jgi:hypothetical protein
VKDSRRTPEKNTVYGLEQQEVSELPHQDYTQPRDYRSNLRKPASAPDYLDDNDRSYPEVTPSGTRATDAAHEGMNVI